MGIGTGVRRGTARATNLKTKYDVNEMIVLVGQPFSGSQSTLDGRPRRTSARRMAMSRTTTPTGKLKRNPRVDLLVSVTLWESNVSSDYATGEADFNLKRKRVGHSILFPTSFPFTWESRLVHHKYLQSRRQKSRRRPVCRRIVLFTVTF